MFVIAMSGKTRGHGLNSFSSCNFIYFLEDEGRFYAYFFNIVALRLHEHLGDSIVGLFLGGGGGGVDWTLQAPWQINYFVAGSKCSIFLLQGFDKIQYHTW